jgi:hypothetical protein
VSLFFFLFGMIVVVLMEFVIVHHYLQSKQEDERVVPVPVPHTTLRDHQLPKDNQKDDATMSDSSQSQKVVVVDAHSTRMMAKSNNRGELEQVDPKQENEDNSILQSRRRLNSNYNHNSKVLVNRTTWHSHKKGPKEESKEKKIVDPLSPEFSIASLQPLLSQQQQHDHHYYNFTLETNNKYLGVLLDAGRHYFSIDWIQRMIDVLSVLHFNLIHFRLTDDQRFTLQLESQPDLAYPLLLVDHDHDHDENSNNNDNKTYTPQELRALVAYAKARNISIMPELNLPGHGGAWAGIPGLIVECPQFICTKGYIWSPLEPYAPAIAAHSHGCPSRDCGHF